jgi:hypothetical protein
MKVFLMASLYYFPNDLFRLKGIRISSYEMDELGQKLGVKISLIASKEGGIGFMSKQILKNMGIDILIVNIEGQEPAVRSAIKTIYEKYGPYETKREEDYKLAKQMLKELQA